MSVCALVAFAFGFREKLLLSDVIKNIEKENKMELYRGLSEIIKNNGINQKSQLEEMLKQNAEFKLKIIEVLKKFVSEELGLVVQDKKNEIKEADKQSFLFSFKFFGNKFKIG